MADRLSALPQRVSLLLRPRRWRRAIGGMAAAAGLGAVFASSVVVGLGLHLWTSEAHRLAAHAVNAALATPLEGRIEIVGVQELSIRGARVQAVRFLDPSGREVMRAENVEGRLATWNLVASIVAGDGPIEVSIPRARVERATVLLVRNEIGAPTLSDVFMPKDTGPSGPPGRPVVLTMPRIEIAEAVGTGDVGIPIDADLRRLAASVLVRTDEVVAVDVRRVGVTERAILGAPITGNASYHLRVDLRPRDDFETGEAGDRLLMWADFVGTVGAVPVSANATMRGLALEASARAASVAPDELRTVLPDVPLARPVSATLDARGVLPHLWLSAGVEIPQGAGMGTITADGALQGGDGFQLSADVLAAEVDPRAFAADLPDSRLDGRARVVFAVDPRDDTPHLGIELATSAAEIGGAVIPAIDAVLDYHRGILLGSMAVHEAGAAIDTRFSFQDGDARFSAVAEIERLAEAGRVSRWLDGALRARIDGSFSGGRLDARGTASIANLGIKPSGARADGGEVTVALTGPPADLTVDATVDLRGLHLGNEHLDRVVARGAGKLLTPRVSLEVTDRERGTIGASALVDVPNRAATGVTFDIERAGERAQGRAERVAIGPAGPEISGVGISGPGLGSLSGSLFIQRGELMGKLSGRDVDLAKVATLAGIPVTMGGIANVDVAVSRTAAGRTGRVEVELESGELMGQGGISARISATLDGTAVRSSGYVRLVDVATDDARARADALGLIGAATICDGVVAEIRYAGAEASLPGGLVDPRAWLDATGEAEIVAENWNLRCLAERMRDADLLERIDGIASTRMRIERKKGDPLPSVRDLYLRTRGLDIAAPDGAFTSSRIDVQIEGGFDATTGTTRLDALLLDGSILAEVDAAAIVDTAALTKADASITETLRSTPFELNVSLPRRRFADLATIPEPFASALPAIEGEVRADLELWGVADELEGKLVAKGFGVMPAAGSKTAAPLGPPLDVTLEGSYDPEASTAALDLELIYQGRGVVAANATIDVAASEILSPREGRPVAWKADVFAQLLELPLGSIPALADRGLSGPVSGRLSLRGLNQRPEADLALSLPDVRVGDRSIAGKIEGKIVPRAAEGPAGAPAATKESRPDDLADATLVVDLEQEGGGRLQFLSHVGAKWTDRLVPSLDTESAGGLALSAQGFRLSTFYPFVANVLSRLDGKMDGNVTIEWGRVGEGWAGRFERAKLALSDVVVFVPQFGQELRNGKATLSLAEVTQRTQELKLSGFEARGSSGRLSGEASLVLTGLRVDAARGAITIREGEELPITVEGVPLGRASGNLTFEAKPTDDSIDVDVRLRSAKILLPESSGRNVQMLDPAHGVVIAQPIEAPVDTSRGPDALRWVFRTTVDDADVRSQMIDVRFRTVESAPLVLELSNEIHASGEIRLSRGAIQLRDRRFEIDQGLVRLRDEEPGNPYVNLTAHWDGPDGTRIYVDYTGILMPITDEKIRFRSDPPKTQAEILALLLFGETGGTAAGLVGTVGSSFATSFASDLLAAAFGGVIRDVAVSVGETEEGDYYGASVSVSDDWRLGGQYEEVGQNETTQGTRKGSCADLYADWRFAKNWSLRGTTGYCSFKGATSTESDESQEFNLGLDILWQYRY